jgi:putative PIN family toxin of toxin-antitoxin system
VKLPVIVLDTVVIVGAILGKPESADAQVLRAVETGGLRLALSDDGLREVIRVLSYPEVEAKIRRPVRAFEVALALGLMGRLYRPRKLDWPSLRDPKDGWVLDLAYDAGADIIVTRDKHLFRVASSLGFEVWTPPKLLEII